MQALKVRPGKAPGLSERLVKRFRKRSAQVVEYVVGIVISRVYPLLDRFDKIPAHLGGRRLFNAVRAGRLIGIVGSGVGNGTLYRFCRRLRLEVG